MNFEFLCIFVLPFHIYIMLTNENLLVFFSLSVSTQCPPFNPSLIQGCLQNFVRVQS